MNLRSALLGGAALLLAASQLSAQPDKSPAAPSPPPAQTADSLPQVPIGAAPGWVTPIQLTAPAGKGGVVMRLLDVQFRTDDKGLHTFQRQITRFNTAASLQLATNLAVQWQPATSSVVVHTARIHRNGTVIDLLSSGSKFTTLRRESQLGAFMIDGILTAYMPVVDLRVGDELEYAFTTTSANPVLGGRVEEEFAVFPGAAVDQLYIGESHPKGRKLQVRFGSALPAAKAGVAGGYVTNTISAQSYAGPKLASDNPLRALENSTVQLSDFSGWGDVSATLSPLFEEAATLAPSSPVRLEVDKIAKAHADPLGRASAALRLVQREVRYFAELQGLGGYKPISADQVWERKIGDCKGKTVLLLAMLRELGIEARPLLVSTKRGEGTDQTLPKPGRFDHVIVLARIGGKDYWLDGTRMDGGKVEDLDSPDFVWGLPLGKAVQGLAAIPADAPRKPQSDWNIVLDARGGVDSPAKASGTAILRGSEAQMMAQAVDIIPPAQLDELNKTLWKARRPGLTIDKAEQAVDPESGEVKLTFSGTAKIDWQRSGADAKFRYEAAGSRQGRNLIADRDELPAEGTPIIVERSFTRLSETVLLPDGGKGFVLDGENYDETIGGITYRRTAKLDGERFEMTTTQVSPRLVLSVSQAKAADESSDNLFARGLYLRLPPALVALDAAKDGAAANKQIETLIEQGKLGQARALIDARLSSNPRDPQLLALNGRLAFIEGKPDVATRTLDAALAINPRLPLALKTKGQLLYEQGRFDDALFVYDRAILVAPDDAELYTLRSLAREMAGDLEGALADRQILVDKASGWIQVRYPQVRLLHQLGRSEQAQVAIEDFAKQAKDDTEAQVWLRTDLLVRQGKGAEALKLLAQHEVGKPNSFTAAVRLNYGLSPSPEATLADILLVVHDSPADAIPPAALAVIAAKPKLLGKLLAAYDAAAAKPGASRERIAIAKGQALRAAGQPAYLLGAFAAAEASRPGDVQLHNEVCWERAIWRIDLAAARTSCMAAIAPARLAMYVDSLAMVELQSGNYALARDLYAEALRELPESPATLYGHGLARLRLGDQGGARELALAKAIDPNIEAEFAAYGLKP